MADGFGFPNAATPLGSSAYYSVRLSPRDRHDALALIHAWNKTLNDVATQVSDPGVARMKLQWWREDIERTFAGGAKHPLTQALAPVIDAAALPLEPFLEQADHVERRIRAILPADAADLEQWLNQGHGALSELLARCLGVADAGLIQRSRRCGLFCGGVYLLRDYGALLRRGFDPLPPAQAPLSTWGEHLRALQPARREAASLPLPLAIQARILAVLLREIADSGYDVRDQRIGLTPLRKLWTAWRTRRQNRFQPISRS